MIGFGQRCLDRGTTYALLEESQHANAGKQSQGVPSHVLYDARFIRSTPPANSGLELATVGLSSNGVQREPQLNELGHSR